MSGRMLDRTEFWGLVLTEDVSKVNGVIRKFKTYQTLWECVLVKNKTTLIASAVNVMPELT